MTEKNLYLLDCTLRDGGYINNWKWGNSSIKAIISLLEKANIDIIEVGFLRNVEQEDDSINVGNTIGFLNQFLPPKIMKETKFCAMLMRSNYDISKLDTYKGEGIDFIRVTAHEYDLDEGIECAKEIKKKGYKVSFNPINIMGYSDEEILKIIEKVNILNPYQFSIVDTFGSMRRNDLNRITELVDHNLNNDIRLGLHLHENMSLSCSLVQMFLEKNLKRSITIDGSLFGMGRIPGNLPLELIADYLNETRETRYDLDYLLDAIQLYISSYKQPSAWGYAPAYFLSARYNLHRNYAEHLLDKENLTVKDINHILSRIEESQKAVYNELYIDKLYEEYLDHEIDDANTVKELAYSIGSKDNIIVLAPGNSLIRYKEFITDYINKKRGIVFTLNFVPNDYVECNYIFFSNNKRFNIAPGIKKCKIIGTSNLRNSDIDYYVNYNSLVGTNNRTNISIVLLLRLLEKIGVKKVDIAGADGYSERGYQYFDDALSVRVPSINHDVEVISALKNLQLDINFLTPSPYNIKDTKEK